MSGIEALCKQDVKDPIFGLPIAASISIFLGSERIGEVPIFIRQSNHSKNTTDIMKKPLFIALVSTVGLSSATAGTWNNQISSVEIGADVRVLAYEKANFEGASIELSGERGDYLNLLDLPLEKDPEQTWNDRISSFKIVDAREEKSPDEASDYLRARFFINSDHAGDALALEAGIEIADLKKHQRRADRIPMTVHEWGTFTEVQGSDGQSIEWYQEPEELVDLPRFVHQSLGFSKTGSRTGMDIVRMETPVLYFYPEGEEALDISVTAGMQGGRITEVFPPAFRINPAKTVWRGRLLPPDSPERKNIPTANGPAGRHYAAARDVSEAWLFRGEQHPSTVRMHEQMRKFAPDHPALPAVAEPIDHFIFYRGAGSPSGVRVQARQDTSDPDKYTLRNSHRATVPKLFGLRVRDGLSSWVEVSNLQQMKYTREGKINEQSFVFPEATQASSIIADEIRIAMVDALTQQGLTMDEALAMVATWDDLWFTEPGTRVLAVLPQVVADEMVPLEISPAPTSISRVFVARLELISRDKEAALMAILNDPRAKADELIADSQRLVDVQLGRYSAGGLERAMTLVAEKMRDRYYALKTTERAQAAEASQDVAAAK